MRRLLAIALRRVADRTDPPLATPLNVCTFWGDGVPIYPPGVTYGGAANPSARITISPQRR